MDLEPEKAGFDAGRLARITDHLEQNYVEPGKIAGCQVLVSRHGYLAYFKSLGRASIERNEALADDAIFRIYSMTKPVTSIALMQLYERGLFQLNDPVTRVIPEWAGQQVYVSGELDNLETRPPRVPMTFRHMLSHRAGLSYGQSRHPVDEAYQEQGINRDRGETLRDFIEKLAHVPLMYDPGERWLYSLATDVCGYLVEALSGQPFDEYLAEHIFEPLGMVDTGFRVSEDRVARLTSNYQRRVDKGLDLIDDGRDSRYSKPTRFFSGGGGLVSTMSDYYRFCEMLRRGGELDGRRVVSPRTIDLMTRNHLPGGADLAGFALGSFSETAYEGIGFGLGFAMTLGQVESGGYGAGDYYWGGAASTIFWVDPAEDLVVIFLTQLMPSGTFNFRGQLKNIIYGAITN